LAHLNLSSLLVPKPNRVEVVRLPGGEAVFSTAVYDMRYAIPAANSATSTTTQLTGIEA
jgi:hypothetical protein